MSNINQCTDFLLRLAMMGKLTHDAGYFRKTLNNIPVLTQIANKMENYESMIF
jgi:hypothetical protein